MSRKEESGTAARDGDRAASPSRAAVPGLVSYGTSHTRPLELVTIEAVQARLAGMRKSVLTSGRLIQESLQHRGARYKAAMLTLTYADADAWEPDHISKLTNHIRMYLKRRGHTLFGVWVAELQQRGAVHYHFVVWLPKGVTLPKPDKQGWWPHGSTQWIWARQAVGYILKYASKVTSKHLYPKHCRISGACGLDKAQRTERRWWRMPRYVRLRWPDWQADVVRSKGGGFVAKATGERMPPLYFFLGLGAGLILLARRDQPEWEPYLTPCTNGILQLP